MRLLWHSHSPLIASGYGQPTALWLPKLKEMGHDVFVSAFQGLAAEVSLYKGIHVLNTDDGKYGMSVLGQLARSSNVDVIVTLMDMWVLPPHDVNALGVPVVHWSTVDCNPLGAPDREYLRRSVGQPVAPSRWGEKILTEAGFKASSVPYAIDPGVFYPDEARREESRRELGGDGRFVVGINAANVERKAWPEQLAAYARLWHEHPGEVLLLANVNMNGAVSPQEVAASLGLPQEAITWSVPGWRDAEGMADWYRALDVLCACVYAEGFGLPAVEAQACGTPAIVPDNPPVSEETGILARKVSCEPMWSSLHHSWWVRPSIASIHEALEDAFAAGRDGPDLAAAEHITRNYSLDVVAPLLETVLENAARRSA